MISKRRFQIALFIAAAGAAGARRKIDRRHPVRFRAQRREKSTNGSAGGTGPEGTYLEISKSGDTYEIQIKDLDKVQTYRGTATSDGISFERNGKAETIRSGKGEQTGMKWLLDKKNCLVIRYGEGYCRD